jgi:polysaccharide export outer membrane protein
MALREDLAEKLKTLVKSPIVTVTVSDITNSKAYYFGGGIKSGVYDLNRRSSLLKVLCQIGDVRGADLKRAYVLRNGKKIKEDLKKLFIDGDITEDIMIESDDVIFIPVLKDKSIFVLGAVNTPKSIEWREGITVMEVILESGGYTKFANQNDTTVVRKEADKETKFKVKAKDLLKSADLNQNIRLNPGDYVIVSESMF